MASGKKFESLENWSESLKEKDSLQINHFLNENSHQRDPLFRSNQTNSIEERSYDRVSKSKDAKDQKAAKR